MWLANLSVQLPIEGLVGRYPTNYLMGGDPILERITALLALPQEKETMRY